MWKKFVFALVTLVPSVLLFASGLALAWVLILGRAPSWLPFLDGCDHFGIYIFACFGTIGGLCMLIAWAGMCLPLFYAWAFTEKKS
jgi:hypothetical protein